MYFNVVSLFMLNEGVEYYVFVLKRGIIYTVVCFIFVGSSSFLQFDLYTTLTTNQQIQVHSYKRDELIV